MNLPFLGIQWCTVLVTDVAHKPDPDNEGKCCSDKAPTRDQTFQMVRQGTVLRDFSTLPLAIVIWSARFFPFTFSRILLYLPAQAPARLMFGFNPATDCQETKWISNSCPKMYHSKDGLWHWNLVPSTLTTLVRKKH